MKRVLAVLALTGSTVLLPTAAFADTTTGDVTTVPVFVVGGASSGDTSTVGAMLPVAGPPVPAGPYAKHGPDAKPAKDEKTPKPAKDDKHGPDGKRGKDDADTSATLSSTSTWDDPTLISGGGRTFG